MYKFGIARAFSSPFPHFLFESIFFITKKQKNKKAYSKLHEFQLLFVGLNINSRKAGSQE